MLGAGIYPITLAEMPTYSRDADRLFATEIHERLKEFLALHPESGDFVPDMGTVRVQRWPLKGRPQYRILYYFRDLNMPLQLLAIYEPGERIPSSKAWRQKVSEMIDELVEQQWARTVVSRIDAGA